MRSVAVIRPCPRLRRDRRDGGEQVLCLAALDPIRGSTAAVPPMPGLRIGKFIRLLQPLLTQTSNGLMSGVPPGGGTPEHGTRHRRQPGQRLRRALVAMC